MYSSIFTKVFCIFIVTIPLARSRKYDLEAESFKLYGEEFNSILRRFRRTPEYLKILEDKRKHMEQHLQEVSVQVMQKDEDVLMQRVADMVGYTLEPNSTEQVATEAPSKPLRLRHYKVRSYGDEARETTEDPVRKLDDYFLLHRQMPTHDRNQFRDLGFEIAGQTVHTIIKAMGPVGGLLPSNNGLGTSEHVTEANKHHNHEVHSTIVSTIAAPSLSSVNEAYKYKRKQTNTLIPRV